MPNANTAVAFFEENVEAVSAYGLSHLADRDERRLYRQGRELVQQVIDQTRKSSRGDLFTTEECKLVVDLYINNDQGLSRTQLGDLAYRMSPGSGHSALSWKAMFGRMETLDNTNPSATQFIINNELAVVAAAADPNRFG